MLRAVQPNGPYFLGGHSHGALIAFEMACQLQAQDQEVAILVLLDTGPSAPLLDRRIHRAVNLMGRLTGLDYDRQRHWFRLVSHLIVSFFDLSRMSRREQVRRLRLIAQKVGRRLISTLPQSSAAEGIPDDLFASRR